MVEWLGQSHSTAPQHSRGNFIHTRRFLNIQRDKIYRASKTSVGEIELTELCIGGRSSIFGSDDESWKTE